MRLIQLSLKYTTSLRSRNRRPFRQWTVSEVCVCACILAGFSITQNTITEMWVSHLCYVMPRVCMQSCVCVCVYIFCRTWAMTTPLVRSSTVLHAASTPKVWIWKRFHRKEEFVYWFFFNLRFASCHFEKKTHTHTHHVCVLVCVSVRERVYPDIRASVTFTRFRKLQSLPNIQFLSFFFRLQTKISIFIHE